MGCWHGWHGCGPWYGPPYDPDWYGPADWQDPGRPRRRRRHSGRVEVEDTAEDLEARLADLRDKIRLMEAELTELRAQEHTATEGR